MTALLGIGEVILEQARTPALVGGGDVVLGSATGHISSAKFVLADLLGVGALSDRVKVASPNSRASVYLIDERGSVPVTARGGIPSLERALDDPETSRTVSWVDTPTDRKWASPEDEDVLREIDRFHPIPDVPARANSWGEWLYFNGRTPAARFYLTFIAGPRQPSSQRMLTVRLQLERNGQVRSYSSSALLSENQLASAPDLTAGGNQVRLIGSEYRIHIDLADESGRGRASGDLVVRARRGRSLPPFTMRGEAGWVSGYVVPVMAGDLSGSIAVGDETINLSGGTAYHDHNWGFWEGVSWRWGQVEGDGLAFVYGRVYPPESAGDSSRLPGVLLALGEQGPAGYATDVTIREVVDASGTQPRRVVVTGRGEGLNVTLDIDINQVTTTRMPLSTFGGEMQFLQMRGLYRVSGQIGNRTLDFTAPGSAETFRP